MNGSAAFTDLRTIKVTDVCPLAGEHAGSEPPRRSIIAADRDDVERMLGRRSRRSGIGRWSRDQPHLQDGLRCTIGSVLDREQDAHHLGFGFPARFIRQCALVVSFGVDLGVEPLDQIIIDRPCDQCVTLDTSTNPTAPGRELIMMRWGMLPPSTGRPPVTNIRNSTSPVP